MKTEELIRLLAEDRTRPRLSVGTRAVVWAGLGTLLSLAVLIMMLGVRPDIGTAATGWRFPLKALFILVLMLGSAAAYMRTSQPLLVAGGANGIILIALAMIVAGVVGELLASHLEQLASGALGKNPGLCLIAIPSLAMAPLIGLLAAMRHGRALVRLARRGRLHDTLHRRLAAVRFGMVLGSDRCGHNDWRASRASSASLVRS